MHPLRPLVRSRVRRGSLFFNDFIIGVKSYMRVTINVTALIPHVINGTMVQMNVWSPLAAWGLVLYTAVE